jgi:hypothetical protein
MTTPEVDSELERLFALGRQATQPDATARERIRAGLAARLSKSAPSLPQRGARRAWLGAGLAAVAVGGAALWLLNAAPAPSVAPSASLPAPTHSTLLAPAPVEAALPGAPAASVAAPILEAPVPKPLAPSAKPAPASPSADPAEELTLVRAMQQALRSGDSARALSLAAEHARRFPKGALVEEREGVRAVAQCRLAAPEARPALLSAFERRFSGSPYAARVKAACQ